MRTRRGAVEHPPTVSPGSHAAPTLDRAELAAWLDERVAQRVRRHEARQATRRVQRAETAERRRHGLAIRHARKLARHPEPETRAGQGTQHCHPQPEPVDTVDTADVTRSAANTAQPGRRTAGNRTDHPDNAPGPGRVHLPGELGRRTGQPDRTADVPLRPRRTCGTWSTRPNRPPTPPRSNPANPLSWSAPQLFIANEPPIVTQNRGNGQWIVARPTVEQCRSPPSRRGHRPRSTPVGTS